MIAWLRLVAIVLLSLLALPALAAAPEGVTILRNVAYGPDKLQAMDVYLPPAPKSAPIILMVHGGGWRIGDKRHPPVFENKVARWVPKGFIFISVNYPMVPQSDPVEQADDIARALAAAQAAAPGWGGDPAWLVIEQLGVQQTVEELITDLAPDQAEAVLLRVLGGFDVAEVARIMDRSPGNVRVLCHRALKRLAARMSEEALAE